MGSDSELDDLEVEVAAEEENEPGYRARLDQLAEVVRVTTSLWVRREEIGLSVEEVAIRSGLSLDEVEAVENNAVDAPFPNLARYAAAVGLRLDVTVTAA
ncbi:MAG: helix-turn-helix domain-containing protein [Actinomycetota bacterium]|nr:helix-turn-helix domain-containing protein [Actinomycetota bacterium]